ncbi:MAG: transposase [Candidatus Marinimicrobia bacterium]|nr:transposase [Candidatus Neomarinimicrobiota bacterium]
MVVHTDQGTAFRSYRWLHQLLCIDHIEVSYSERGAKDNPWIESLWSRLKAEVGQVLFESETLQELWDMVQDYVEYYMHQRRHQSLDQRIPIEVLWNQNKNGALNAQALAQIVL